MSRPLEASHSGSFVRAVEDRLMVDSTPVMDRRAFIGTLTGGLLATPLAVEAQPAKAARIGVLSTGNPRSADIYQALEQRLGELGYVEGQNLAIEFRNAEGRTERLPGIASE